ncbi:hypothetical protein VMCG_09924 [Cytospora schulzeri]|uniref:Protein kinase domain-containing protein n=1 Tax=Cytospora schulzeri TaxID=448051 RepID=A0A423VF31_9PEZI|nr:hypothetical protein VMCG_09924 [Valsa malicola]
MSVADKCKLLGRPRKARALTIDDDRVVGELVAPAQFPLGILGSGVYRCDFGILLFHNIEPSFASDMWSYMVVFLYLCTEHPAFTGRQFAGKVSSIFELVGLLPLEWKGHYSAYDKEEAKQSWYDQGSPSKSMFSAFLDQHRPDISANEKALALSLIRQVFRPRPRDRVGASELLENKDFKALMSIDGV